MAGTRSPADAKPPIGSHPSGPLGSGEPRPPYEGRRGKCASCKIVWVWRGRLRLRTAHCPRCGTPLRRTSRLSQRELVRGRPAIMLELFDEP